MKRLFVSALVFALLGFAAVASAQTKPANPRTLEFTPSVDHTAATSYTLGYFLPGATDPVQSVSIGKPAPNAQNVCAVTINTQPLTFGLNYTAKLKTLISAGVESEWSEPSNPFDRVPGPPGKPAVK
jgi:hypothetical protein